jgi:hypothetical protein
MRRKLIIEKQSTTKNDTTTTYSDDDSYDEDTDFTRTEVTGEGEGFISIVNSDYRRPRNGTVQDNLTTDQIKAKLKGFIPLKTMEEKRVLERMPLFKTWIRYINKDTRQFRTGGLLMKVAYPDYVMLVNTKMNITWSVQLNENIIFIRDPKLVVDKQKEKQKENHIKNTLFDMYRKGELRPNK